MLLLFVCLFVWGGVLNLTLTVPLSTQEYKWVSENQMMGTGEGGEGVGGGINPMPD